MGLVNIKKVKKLKSFGFFRTGISGFGGRIFAPYPTPIKNRIFRVSGFSGSGFLGSGFLPYFWVGSVFRVSGFWSPLNPSSTLSISLGFWVFQVCLPRPILIISTKMHFDICIREFIWSNLRFACWNIFIRFSGNNPHIYRISFQVFKIV